MRRSITLAAAMLAMLTAIAAPSKKGEKASPAKNRDADRSAEFRNGTITKTTAATFKPERTTPVQTGEFQVDLVVITFPDCIQPQSVEAVRSALKIKSPETVFFNCPTEEALLAKKDEIRRWILLSQPVMLVRQSRPLNDEISQRWPLDIAIIDGLGFDAETFHVVFPGGSDRGRKEQRGGYIKLGELLYRTSDAMLMFYRPGAAETAKKKR